MKRLLLALICGVLGLAPLPTASPASHSNPPNDAANGSGVFDSGRVSFNVSATSGPTGENAQGTYQFSSPDGQVTGNVSCLDVQGSKATVGGPITSSTVTGPGAPFFAVGRGVVFTVFDNGPGTPDAISRFQSGSPPTVCTDQLLFGTLEQGDVVVHDAPPCEKPKRQNDGIKCKKEKG